MLKMRLLIVMQHRRALALQRLAAAAAAAWLPMYASGEPWSNTPTRRAKPPGLLSTTTLFIFEENAFSLLPKDRPRLRQHGLHASLPSPAEEHEFDRSEMMIRLSRAISKIEIPATTAKSSPSGTGRPDGRAIDEVVALAVSIAEDDPEYSSDVCYLQHAQNLCRAVELLKGAIMSGDEGKKNSALLEVRQSCDECHRRFNP
jgi:hypothetical protein